MSLCIEHIGFEPEVKGAAVLIKAPKFETVTASGIQLPSSYLREKEIGTSIGLILSISPHAFKGSDERTAKHFSTFECKVGDWVEYSIYERQPSSMKLSKKDTKPTCYYINDERILSVIKPEDLKFYIEDIKV